MSRIKINGMILPFTLFVIGCSVTAFAQVPQNHGQPAAVFNVAVPTHLYDLILTRPEKDSVTVSVLSYQELEGFVAYGMHPGVYSSKTPVRQLMKGEPVEWRLAGLHADTLYYYQFHRLINYF